MKFTYDLHTQKYVYTGTQQNNSEKSQCLAGEQLWKMGERWVASGLGIEPGEGHHERKTLSVWTVAFITGKSEYCKVVSVAIEVCIMAGITEWWTALRTPALL